MEDEKYLGHPEKPKRKVEFEVPTISKKYIFLILIIVLILALFVLYQQGYISPSIISLNKGQIIFIQPVGCPDSLCNTSTIRNLARQVDLDFEVKDSFGLRQPIAMVSGINNTLSFVNLASVKSFMNDICVYNNNDKACKAFSDNIQKSNKVNIMLFTTYSPLALSLNDVRARNVVFAVQNKINDSSLTVTPKFAVFANLSDSRSLLTTEVQEVARQTCIRNEQPQFFWLYAGCIDSFLLNNRWTQTSWQQCASSVGVDGTKLNDCLQNRALGYVFNEANFAFQNNITTIPLIFINGDIYTSALDSNALKETVCFYYEPTAKPAAC